MKEPRFFNYVEANAGEKHLGIATVTVEDYIYLKYKVLPAKSGSGYFIVPPSYKDNEEWKHWFKIDSSSIQNVIQNLIREKVAEHYGKSSSYKDTQSQMPF